MRTCAAYISTACFSRYCFTGKERDSESGNDYFGARYYASSMGRFMSPDPKIMTARHLANPQKWNKYAYVKPGDRRDVHPRSFESKDMILVLSLRGWLKQRHRAEKF